MESRFHNRSKLAAGETARALAIAGGASRAVSPAGGARAFGLRRDAITIGE